MIIGYLVKEFTNFVIANDMFYSWNGKYYEPMDDWKVGKKIYRWYVEHNLISKWNATKEKEIKMLLWYVDEIPHVLLDEEEGLLNLNNCILNLETLELMPHDPKRFFSYALSVSYNPDAHDCPVFLNFLAGCFAKSGKWPETPQDEGYRTDPIMVKNIIRLMGYLIYPKITITGMFICLGEGSNGKGILFRLMNSFFPVKYVTGLSLGEISDPKNMDRSQLIWSRLNISTEEKNETINTEEIKKITDGEMISVSLKYKDKISIFPRCKLFVSSNHHMHFNDSSYGAKRRMFYFNFINRFYDPESYRKLVRPEERHFFVGKPKEWINEQLNNERESILNLMIQGLKDLKADNWKFIESVNMEDLKEEQDSVNDPIGSWLLDHYELGEGEDCLAAPEIYNEFVEYYNINYAKRCPYSAITVGKRIRDVFRVVQQKEYHNDEATGKVRQMISYCLRNKTMKDVKETDGIKELL
jgi:putative DNA primase/helicase